MKPDKHWLYQQSVQDPEGDIELYREMASRLRPELGGEGPWLMREDFCGTFALSCAWAKLGPRHRAIGLDIDPAPIAYGTKHNLAKLSPGERARVEILRQDVISETRPEADLIVAGNFSYFFLKERETLLRYFRMALRSLKPGGLHFLETIGGPGFVEKCRERRRVEPDDGKPFTYIWEQRGFDPVTSEGSCAIHFELPGKKLLQDVFVYDWRLWGIREVREAMLDAGFASVHVFWENERTGRYEPTERGGDDDDRWIAYIAGQKPGPGTPGPKPVGRLGAGPSPRGQ